MKQSNFNAIKVAQSQGVGMATSAEATPYAAANILSLDSIPPVAGRSAIAMPQADANGILRDSQAQLSVEYNPIIFGTESGGEITVGGGHGTWKREGSGVASITYNSPPGTQRTEKIELNSGGVAVTETYVNERDPKASVEVVRQYDQSEMLVRRTVTQTATGNRDEASFDKGRPTAFESQSTLYLLVREDGGGDVKTISNNLQFDDKGYVALRTVQTHLMLEYGSTEDVTVRTDLNGTRKIVDGDERGVSEHGGGDAQKDGQDRVITRDENIWDASGRLLETHETENLTRTLNDGTQVDGYKRTSDRTFDDKGRFFSSVDYEKYLESDGSVTEVYTTLKRRSGIIFKYTSDQTQTGAFGKLISSETITSTEMGNDNGKEFVVTDLIGDERRIEGTRSLTSYDDNGTSSIATYTWRHGDWKNDQDIFSSLTPTPAQNSSAAPPQQQLVDSTNLKTPIAKTVVPRMKV